jgi:hypothetical protein
MSPHVGFKVMVGPRQNIILETPQKIPFKKNALQFDSSNKKAKGIGKYYKHCLKLSWSKLFSKRRPTTERMHSSKQINFSDLESASLRGLAKMKNFRKDSVNLLTLLTSNDL